MTAATSAIDGRRRAGRAPSLRMPGLSGIFISVWLAPLAVICTGLLQFEYVTPIDVLILASPVFAAWFAMRATPRGPARHPKLEDGGFSIRELRFNFVLFLGAAAAGSYLLRMAYGRSGLDMSGGIQEMYIAAVMMGREGELSTGGLGTIAQILRTAQPFAMIFGVFLLYAEKSVLGRLLIAALLMSSTAFAYAASFSRGSIMFYLACILMAAWCLPIRRSKLLVAGGALLLLGGAFFMTSSRDRVEAAGISEANQLDAIQALFQYKPTPLTNAAVDVGGTQLLGLGLYIVSPVAEGSHVVEQGHSPMLMGGWSFYPLVNPVKRILGLDTTLDMGGVSRLNVWYSVMGDLYIDFSWGAFIAFPLLAYVMYRLALRYRYAGLWGQVHFLITAVYFVLFPFYSVFLTYGLIYAASLTLAIRSDMVMRQARRARTLACAEV